MKFARLESLAGQMTTEVVNAREEVKKAIEDQKSAALKEAARQLEESGSIQLSEDCIKKLAHMKNLLGECEGVIQLAEDLAAACSRIAADAPEPAKPRKDIKQRVNATATLMAALERRLNDEEFRVLPIRGDEGLMRETGLQEDTIRSILKRMHNDGILKHNGKRGYTSAYKLNKLGNYAIARAAKDAEERQLELEAA